MEMLTSWEKYGFELGLEQGRAEGRAEERVAILKRMFTLKFGELPAEFIEKLEGTKDREALYTVADQVLSVNSVNEVVFEKFQAVDEGSDHNNHV